MAIRKLTGSQLKEFRKSVAKLKQLGLVSKKIDARSQKPTRYMRGQIEKRFAGVLSGKAAVVKVPNAKVRKQFKPREGEETGLYDVKNGYVIVPIEQGQKKPRFNKRTKKIESTVELYGRKSKRTYERVNADTAKEISNSNPNVRYTVQTAWGALVSFDNYEDLEAFMYSYETRGKNPFKNWREFVVVDHIEDDETE